MRRILLGGILLFLTVLSGHTKDLLISRWAFSGNSKAPDCVLQSIRPFTASLYSVLPVDCPSCPFVQSFPISGPGHGTYGWPTSSIPDISRYLKIPRYVQPGWRLDVSRLTFETQLESQAAARWQIRYGKNNFSGSTASRAMGIPHLWSTVTILLSPLLMLQDFADTVIFWIYPFEAKKEPNDINNTFRRLDSVRICYARAPLPAQLTRIIEEPGGKDIRLQRSTLTEINSESFGFEHALDGQPFDKLDRVPAARWSVALQPY